MMVAFVITGTPTVVFENYPCGLQDTFYIVPIGPCDLRFTNLSGSQTICSVSNFNSISEQADNPEIKIYPNPAGNELFVNGYSLMGEKEINIYDMMGKQIQTISNNFKQPQTKIDISSLKPGIYFIELISSEQSFRRKFLVSANH